MYTRTNHVNQDEHVVMHSDFTLVDGWDELRILLAKVLRLGQLSLSTQVVISGGKGRMCGRIQSKGWLRFMCI
jgi:hypothetical protein